MYCSRCGSGNTNDSLYCKDCGNHLGGYTCPNCNQVIKGNVSYCPNCGYMVKKIEPTYHNLSQGYLPNEKLEPTPFDPTKGYYKKPLVIISFIIMALVLPILLTYAIDLNRAPTKSTPPTKQDPANNYVSRIVEPRVDLLKLK